MATVADLETELTESVALTEKVIDDIQLLSLMVFPVKTATSAAVLFQAKSNALFQYLTTTEKALAVASKLPIVGGPLTGLRILANGSIESLQNAKLALDIVDKPLLVADASLTGVSLGLTSANVMASTALSINSDRLDVVQALQTSTIVDSDDKLTGLTEDNFNQLVEANDITAEVVGATQAARDAVLTLDTTILDAFAGALEDANDILDSALDVFDEFDEAMDALNEAIKPVEWALDMADAVVEDVVEPVIRAVLEATGLQGLVDQLADQIFGELSILDTLTDYADRVRVELEDNDFAGVITDFWDDFGALFDVGGGIDLAATIGKIEIEGEDGNSILGTDGDDSLVGTDGDDNFAPLTGNDTVDGGDGTDRVFLTGGIDEYRVELVNGTDISVVPRGEGSPDEGEDYYTNVELLRFATDGIGDVTSDDITRFQYTEPGQPNLTGDDLEDWLFGDGNANQLRGGGADDVLVGGGGDDILNGDAGNDLIFAGDGDDHIFVDLFTGDAGVDTVDGGAGKDELVIEGSDGLIVDFLNEVIYPGGGQVMGFSNIEQVKTDLGDDSFLGGTGAETIFGGGGYDKYHYAGVGDTFYGTTTSSSDDGVAFVSFDGGGYLGVRIETVLDPDDVYGVMTYHGHVGATDPADSLTGALYGSMTIEGTDYSDLFYGYGVTHKGDAVGDTDWVFDYKGGSYALDGLAYLGGAGSDVFFASEHSNFFDGGEGFDIVNFNLDYTIAERLSDSGAQSFHIDLTTGIATTLKPSGAEKTDTYLANVEGVVGSRVDDVIIGNDEANYLYGYLGHDTISGGGGDDYIDASGLIGADLSGGTGNDIFALGASEDAMIDGGAGSDAIELLPDQAFRLDVFFDQEALGDTSSRYFNVSGWEVDLTAGTAISQFFDEEEVPSNDVPFTYTMSLTSIENVLASDMDDVISGNADDNLVLGRGGSDVILGLAGDDNLNGGAGDDSVDGGDGDDVVYGEAGNDTLTGGAGKDIFVLQPEDMVDVITDFDLVDDMLSVVAYGLAFDDFTLTQSGADTEIRVEDKVIAVILGVNAGDLKEDHFEVAELATFDPIPQGTDGDDLLDARGLIRPDDEAGVAMSGLGGNDTLIGADGDDTLSGNAGENVLAGGAGADVFAHAVDGGNDVITDFVLGQDLLVIDGLSFGTDQGDTDPADFLTANALIDGDDLVIGLGNGQSVRLTDLAAASGLTDPADFATMLMLDYVPVPPGENTEGTEGGDLMEGTAGDDTISAGAGNDTIIGGDGDDSVSGGDNADSIDGGNGNDILRSNHGSDTIHGGNGNDFLGDWAGWSFLDGGDGNDTLDAGAGNDTLIGGDGDDRMSGGEHADSIEGGAGNDTIWSNHGSDSVWAGAGDDFVGDWAGWSRLVGGAGNDTLSGGAGEDTLIGGEGDDSMTGGSHSDTFIVAGDSGNDTITDFVVGEDRLTLSDFDIGDAEGQTSGSDMLAATGAIDGGTDLVLDLGDGRTIRLINVVDDTIGDEVEDYEDIFLPI